MLSPNTRKEDVIVTAGQSIENRSTGERIVFRRTAADTGGEALVYESHLSPGGRGLPAHVHAGQEERFQVVLGSVTFVVGGRETTVAAGQRVTVPAGTPHTYGNPTGEPAVLVAEIRPALKLESLLETLWQLAAPGTPGIARLLRVAAVADAHFETARLVHPHPSLQRAALRLTMRLAHPRPAAA